VRALEFVVEVAVVLAERPQAQLVRVEGARVAAIPRRGTLRSFGRLPREGHDSHPGHRAGEGIPQGALLRAGHLRQERLQDLKWVYGFKVALVVDPGGVITAFGLAETSSDERPIADALVASDRHEAYLADKGFTGVQWERRWLEEYGALVAATPYDDSRRAWPKADRRWAAGKRQIVEGVIGQLKDFFALERHRAKTLRGLLTRLAAKVAAYTCIQRIIDSIGRPLRQLADFLV
jgi:DDE family transposase